MKIESSKDHIEHVLKLKGREQQIEAMKGFWEWLAAMPEFQRRVYFQDLLKAEHFLPDDSQKAEIKSLREDAMIELPDETRRIIERTFENLHEETHGEKEEPLE